MRSRVIKVILVCALPVAFSGAVADEVTIPNVFTSGTPAVAAEVNENFAAVRDSINDNNARLAAVEASGFPASMGFDTATYGRTTLTNVRINGGQIVGPVAAGSAVQIDADFAINNSPSCPSCIIQIRVGFEGVAGLDCVYNGIPSPAPNPPTTGSGSVVLTAPTTPGVYHIVSDSTAQFSCIRDGAINPRGLGQLIGVIAVE